MFIYFRLLQGSTLIRGSDKIDQYQQHRVTWSLVVTQWALPNTLHCLAWLWDIPFKKIFQETTSCNKQLIRVHIHVDIFLSGYYIFSHPVYSIGHRHVRAISGSLFLMNELLLVVYMYVLYYINWITGSRLSRKKVSFYQLTIRQKKKRYQQLQFTNTCNCY